MIQTLWSQTLFPHRFGTFNLSLKWINNANNMTQISLQSGAHRCVIARVHPEHRRLVLLLASWDMQTSCCEGMNCKLAVLRLCLLTPLTSAYCISGCTWSINRCRMHQRRMYVDTGRLVNIFTPSTPPPSQSRVESWDVFAAILRIVCLGLFLRRRHRAC